MKHAMLKVVTAAGLLAFSLVFYLPSATIPLEPDTLMILPHVLAVFLAWRNKPLAAGVAAGGRDNGAPGIRAA